MKSDSRAYYFVRVNGNTAHNNKHNTNGYVPGEPPKWENHGTYINYFQYCLDHNIIRIGWPDTGDLNSDNARGALANEYRLHSLPPYKQEYLIGFRDMPIGSIVLMPNRDKPGDLYIGEIVGKYEYKHDLPKKDGETPKYPYECAHRHKVRWDSCNGKPIKYKAANCGIPIHGAFWTKAFAQIDAMKPGLTWVRSIEAERNRKNKKLEG